MIFCIFPFQFFSVQNLLALAKHYKHKIIEYLLKNSCSEFVLTIFKKVGDRKSCFKLNCFLTFLSQNYRVYHAWLYKYVITLRYKLVDFQAPTTTKNKNGNLISPSIQGSKVKLATQRCVRWILVGY